MKTADARNETAPIIVPNEVIIDRIYLFRGQKVMLDGDLAELYGVSTRRLNEQVRRNIRRFPKDFMFELRPQEAKILMSQIATSSSRHGGRRKLPLVFTEQGVAMLSTVLNSDRAIDVNIAIIRAFVKLRELLATNKALARKIESMEKRYDAQFIEIFSAIRALMDPEEIPRSRQIGFESDP